MENNKYSKDDLYRLMEFVDNGERRITEARKTICKNTSEFDVWYKYSTPQTRNDFKSMLSTNCLIGDLIYNKIGWLRDKKYFGMVIELEFILQAIENLFYEGKISKKEISNIKKEMVRLNFGSMINEW